MLQKCLLTFLNSVPFSNKFISIAHPKSIKRKLGESDSTDGLENSKNVKFQSIKYEKSHSHSHQQKVVWFNVCMNDVTRMQVITNVQNFSAEMHHQRFVHDFCGGLSYTIVDI